MESVIEFLRWLWRILAFQRGGMMMAVTGVKNVPVLVPVSSAGGVPVLKKKRTTHNHQTRHNKKKRVRKIASESRRRNRPKK